MNDVCRPHFVTLPDNLPDQKNQAQTRFICVAMVGPVQRRIADHKGDCWRLAWVADPREGQQYSLLAPQSHDPAAGSEVPNNPVVRIEQPHRRVLTSQSVGDLPADLVDRATGPLLWIHL